MVRINLLPWREQLREERKRQFMMSLALTFVFGVFIVFLGNQYYEKKVEEQQARNDLLKSEIAKLDENLKLIQELKKEKDALLSRMRIIQDLQSNRQILAKLLDQFVRTLPEGVFYTALSKTGVTITITGMTVSNNRVSQLMRNFENSPWLTKPNLTVIARLNQKDPNDKSARFSLSVNQSAPKDGESK